MGRRTRPRRCCPPSCATCSASPAARSSGSSSSCRSTWCASTGSRTARCSGCPGESRAAQLAAFDGLAPGLGQQWVDHVDVVRRRLGGAAPRLLRGAVDSRRAAPGRGRAAGHARGAAQAAQEAVQGRAAARRSPPTRSSPTGTTCATCRRGRAWSPTSSSGSGPGPSRAGWVCSPRRSTDAAGDPSGDRGDGRRRSQDLVVRDGPGGRRGHRPRAARRRGRRRGRDRPAPAARARAVRRAHDARDAARRLPRRARRRPLPDDLAAMPHEMVLHGDPMLVVRTGGTRPGRPRRVDGARAAASSPRTSCARWPGTASTCGRTWSSGSTGPRATWSSSGSSSPLRRAVAGPRDGPPPARPAHPDRRACTPPARTPPRAAASPSSGCPRRWSRRRSGRRR